MGGVQASLPLICLKGDEARKKRTTPDVQPELLEGGKTATSTLQGNRGAKGIRSSGIR